jgi:hypothetical protein
MEKKTLKKKRRIFMPTNALIRKPSERKHNAYGNDQMENKLPDVFLGKKRNKF